MRVLNFNLIVVLSCIAMIGATPVGDSAATEDAIPFGKIFNLAKAAAYVPY